MSKGHYVDAKQHVHTHICHSHTTHPNTHAHNHTHTHLQLQYCLLTYTCTYVCHCTYTYIYTLLKNNYALSSWMPIAISHRGQVSCPYQHGNIRSGCLCVFFKINFNISQSRTL
ncbi:hypothetical protein EON64_04520 [archaeon]|nr:MAG: hypothetical protein EON64_04520 [archaeon]